ncbi:MAG: DHH family phosphoesterase [Candidatus Diapherotrites archaeon]|nr:DHH family phosphoesterase [Candidatus Diapherotrites archaeon]MDZ4256846.1 DHH family phosphoesterase [archaeon]
MPNEIIITCCKDPDLDGFASAIGYAELLSKTGTPTIPWISGNVHPEVHFVMKKFDFPYPVETTNPENFAQFVLVDSSELNGLDKRIKPENVIEIIDHRKINDSHLFPNAKIQIELVGSAATLITEKFKEKQVTPSAKAAALLYSAIVSNTLNFKAKVTTQRDMAMAEWLLQQFQLPTNYVHEMFAAKSDLSGNRLQNGIRGDFAWFALGNKKIGIAQLEIVGGSELASRRSDEIIEELSQLKVEKGLDLIFMSIIELEEGFNLFITKDQEAQRILSELFDITFNDTIAKRNGLIMRKEIVPLLKEKLQAH